MEADCPGKIYLCLLHGFTAGPEDSRSIRTHSGFCFGCFNQAVDDCACLCIAGGIHVNPVHSSQSEGPYSLFGKVVMQRDIGSGRNREDTFPDSDNTGMHVQ